MNREEFRRSLIQRDGETREGRVARWSELSRATYAAQLPNIIWDFLTMLTSLYIDGYFVPVVVVAAGILESSLKDQIKATESVPQEWIKKLDLYGLVELSRVLGLVTESEKEDCHHVRKIRNHLVHLDESQLAKSGRQRFPTWGGDNAIALMAMLRFDEGVKDDAVRAVELTRQLTLRFYGTDEDSGC